jgi:hypothetical protein
MYLNWAWQRTRAGSDPRKNSYEISSTSQSSCRWYMPGSLSCNTYFEACHCSNSPAFGWSRNTKASRVLIYSLQECLQVHPGTYSFHFVASKVLVIKKMKLFMGKYHNFYIFWTNWSEYCRHRGECPLRYFAVQSGRLSYDCYMIVTIDGVWIGNRI